MLVVPATVPPTGPAWGSERGSLVPGQQDPADQLDGDAALPHEVVVEGLQLVALTFRFAVVLAQFVNLQLAQRVVEVRRVIGAAPRLLVGRGRLLEPFLLEDLRALRSPSPYPSSTVICSQ